MRLAQIFLRIGVIYMLSLCISCKTSFPKKYSSQASTRVDLQMPKLLNKEKIKKELPLSELRKKQMEAKENGYAMSPLNYNFKLIKLEIF